MNIEERPVNPEALTPHVLLKVQNAQDAREAIAQYRAVNFADALGDTSVRTRRWLLLFSVTGIVVANYSVNLKQIPWLDIPSPENSGDLIPTILLVAIVYHWVSFALYGISDIFKWHVSADEMIFGNRSQMVFRLDEHVRQLASHLQNVPTGDGAASWLGIEKTIAGARDVADNSIAEWKSYYARARISFTLKQIAVWGIELTLPLALGLLSSWRLCSSMLHR
jgi:hypothetical protein